ncbi:substrate-binding periplasmic protein [Silvanigrella sp.]|uniref:substrate-binding periplasmic protein n=1 Tax=Silvanigrella sp. TaxID=2024976 RepID=UPI0037C8FA33
MPIKLSLSLLIISIFCSNKIKAESINVAWNPWCPWMCDSDEKPGFSVELVENAFKRQDINVQFQKYSWTIAVSEVREGKVNGILAPAKLEAPDFIFPKEPVGYQQMCFYVKKDSTWVYKNIDSLKNISIAIIQGAHYPGLMEYINKNSDKKNKIKNISTEELFPDGFKNLLNNSYQSLVLDSVTFDYYLKKNNLIDQVKKVGCLKTEYLYFALSPKNKDKSLKLSKIFDDYIVMYKSTDSYQKLYDKYNAS